jgi:hypothetical protein
MPMLPETPSSDHVDQAGTANGTTSDLLIDIDDEPPTQEPDLIQGETFPKSKTRRSLLKSAHLWIAVFLAAGAMTLAIYSLRLQKWSAVNEFWNSCATQKTVRPSYGNLVA